MAPTAESDRRPAESSHVHAIPPETGAVVVQDGQVVADITQEFAEFKAGLRHLPHLKIWELELEIGGVITPTDARAPFFVQTAGACLSVLQVGNGLEQLSARLREAEGRYR